MKEFNMTSLMKKASKNNKSAMLRAEEAKKEAAAAREAREAERKQREEERKQREADRLERLKQQAGERASEVQKASEEDQVKALHARIIQTNRDDAKAFKKDWKKILQENPSTFFETLHRIESVAEEFMVQDVLSTVRYVYRESEYVRPIFESLNTLRNRQAALKKDVMAKVTPWDQAAREAALLADKAFQYNLPEVGKEANQILREINLYK